MALTGAHSPAERRQQIVSFLVHQRSGILCCTGSKRIDPGVWALPVWYRAALGTSDGAIRPLDCIIPRWTDLAHELAEDSPVILIVQDFSGGGLRWLQIQGVSRPVETPDWPRLLPRWISTAQPDALYLVVKVTPGRIDLIDEELGWGVQATVEV